MLCPICPRPLTPSWLTSIIFSSIHLIIHVHGKFLKKPVAELEAERGTGFVKSTGSGPQCQQDQLTRMSLR